MDLSHFRMLIHEILNNDPYIVTKEFPLIILDSKYAVYMAKHCKYTKNTRTIARRVHSVINVEKFKINNIDWYEGGLQLADIATKNVEENDLNLIMKYIIVSIEN